MSKLTNKQEAFCQQYVIDKNATQAAIRAGYSEKTAKESGYENLTKPHVKARVDELLSEVSEKALCDAQWVVERLMREAEAQGIAAEDTTSSARTAALKALAEYTGGFDANKKKVEHSGEGISFEMNFGTNDD